MKAVDAITFNGLVAYGRDHGANMVNGMPWSFVYQGRPVSHENDDLYLVNQPDGETLRMGREHVLVTLDTGRLILCTVP
jgi:hypothetical protein